MKPTEAAFSTVALVPPAPGRSFVYFKKLMRPGQAWLEFGTGIVEAGRRIPAEGSVALKAQDFGFFLAGTLTAGIEGTEIPLPAGVMCHVGEGIEQWGHYHEETRLAYALFGDAVELPDLPLSTVDVLEVRNVQVLSRAAGPAMTTGPLFRIHHPGPVHLHVGTGRMLAGDCIPASGSTSSPAHDIEIVVSGRVIATLDGVDYELTAGDIVAIAPGTTRAVRFLEDTEIVFLFFGDCVPAMDTGSLVGN
jgi:hypothetical protein